MKKNFKKNEFMSVIQTVDEINSENLKKKEPINCILPVELAAICEESGVSSVEIGVLLRVSTAITYGLLQNREDVRLLKSDDLGQIIVQLEQIRTILK